MLGKINPCRITALTVRSRQRCKGRRWRKKKSRKSTRRCKIKPQSRKIKDLMEFIMEFILDSKSSRQHALALLLSFRVKGQWHKHNTKSLESMLFKEKYTFLCNNNCLCSGWKLDWKGNLTSSTSSGCATYFSRCLDRGRLRQILLKSGLRQWQRGTLRKRWMSLKHFPQRKSSRTFSFNFWEKSSLLRCSALSFLPPSQSFQDQLKMMSRSRKWEFKIGLFLQQYD